MKIKSWLLVILTGLIGWAVGWYSMPLRNHPQPPKERFDEKRCEYKYINSLRCENAIISDQTGLFPLEKKLSDYIKLETGREKINGISIYYRDLNSGPIISVNEKEKFTPASLLKLPVLIAYYKLAEIKPEILETRTGKNYVPSAESLNVDSSEKTIEPGKEYTIEELIEKMIVYSDNRSKELLLQYLGEINPDYDLLLQTINDLGIATDTSIVDNFISAKGVASIFRILYNGAYLNNDMSEKALGLLTKVEFKEGLRGGVPPYIEIAHKFGDRIEPDGMLQRHDCGIIYAPARNYLLCVMTRGSDVNAMSNAIKTISQTIYEDTNAGKK